MDCRYFDRISETCDHKDYRNKPCQGNNCEIKKRLEQVLVTKSEIFDEAKIMAHNVLWLLYLATGNKYAIVRYEKGELKNPFLTI